MSIKTVAPYATKDLSVPIGQKIAISTNGGDNVTIWYQTNAGVSPVGWYVHDVITNEAVLLGTFSGVQGIRIETQSSPALYNIGVSPTIGVGDASTLNGYTQDATATADTIALRDSNGDIQANAFESTVVTGTAPLTVASITKVANLNADLLDDLNSATASTASTIAARDVSGNLTANVLISDVAIGTAPLTVTSTTKVANFNADLLDDLNTATASTASTVAARDASGNLTANVLISDVAIGTAPLNVTSTTVVPNLNVDQTDGYDVAETATVSTIAARDAGGDITANAFESTVATGTAPLTVASITKVANLNADLLDDLNSATASTASTIAARDASGNLTANVLISDVAVGTAPLTVTSTTKVANLNADLLDDLNTATASTASTVAARDASGNLTANVLISDVAIGTAPLTVTSTTKAANLNADLLDDQEGSYYLNATNISSGTLADARLSSNVVLRDGTQTITGVKTIGNDLGFRVGEPADGAVEMVYNSTSKLFTIFTSFGGYYTGSALIYDSTVDQWMIDGYQIISKNTVQDTPVNGNIDVPISSNWAYDHVAAADPHAGYMLESNIGTGAGNYLALNGSSQIPAVSGALLTNVNAATVGSLVAGSFLRADADDTASGIITLSSNSEHPLRITGTHNNKILLSGSSQPNIRFQESTTDKANIRWSPDGYILLYNIEDDAGLRIKDDLDFSPDAGAHYYSIYHENNFGKTEIDALGINATSVTGAVYPAQGAQTAKTTSTTLTAAEINTGIITVNNGAAGTTTLTLPLATAMDSQFTGVAAGYSWDFSVVNISTTAAEDADVGTNTGWTLVGNMDIEADDDPRARSSAKFRARKTGAGAWTLYRTA